VQRRSQFVLCFGVVALTTGFMAAQQTAPVRHRDAAQATTPNRGGEPGTHRAVPPSPAARYSPLAAQGGYQGQRATWYEALFRALNPKETDWGLRWEQRRSIFLANSVGNKYFVYTGALSLLLIFLTIVILWQRWDHAERLHALAQSTADALNYGKYWKQAASEAIRRHNDHVERCNRVIEAGENGLPLGDAAEAIRLRRELEESRTEMLNLTTTNKRLQSELDQKAGLIADLSQRVDEVARKTGNGGPAGKGAQQSSQVASLVERINRLEEALKAARRENEILKGA
jgi:DNA-binding transcriptional MerR regulator